MEDKTQRMAVKVADAAGRMGWFESAMFEEGDEVVAVAVVTKSMIEQMTAELVEGNPGLDLETCKRDLEAIMQFDFSPKGVWDNAFCYERCETGISNLIQTQEYMSSRGEQEVAEER